MNGENMQFEKCVEQSVGLFKGMACSYASFNQEVKKYMYEDVADIDKRCNSPFVPKYDGFP